MDYILPAFAEFKKNTQDLDTRFSIDLGRHTVVAIVDPKLPATYATPVKRNSLEILIYNIEQAVLSCETERSGACDVFRQLTLELREINKQDNEQEKKQAARFLLGALLHRYFRIIEEYKKGFFSTNPTASGLFQAIRAALNLNVAETKNYNTEDLKSLDGKTIIDALTSFHANMTMILPDKKVERYKTYPHFVKDKHFLPYLENIIAEQGFKAAPLMNQFNAISFIQSLLDKIEQQNVVVEKELTAWVAELKRNESDFESLTIDAIIKHHANYSKSEFLKNRIQFLLDTKEVEDNFANYTYDNFAAELSALNTHLGSYILFGGYTMVLKSNGIKPDLQCTLEKALKADKKSNKLSEESFEAGISAFSNFIAHDPSALDKLDFRFFGNKEKMQTVLSNVEKALRNAAPAEQVLSSLAVV